MIRPFAAVVVSLLSVAVAQTPPAPPAPAPAPVQKPVPAPGTQEGQKPPAPQNGGPQGQEQGKPPADVPKPDEPKIEKPPEDAPIPAGFNPADLRAMKSAQQMIEAERSLAELLKAGKIKGLDKIVTFDELSNWPYEDGLKGMPKGLRELDGKKVLMTGFMLPIDEVQNIKEFLLVQSLWSCCYGSPPDINGIVRVVLPKGKTTDYFFDPLKIIGKFKVEATVLDGYCVDIYQLEVESLEAIKVK